MARVILKIAYLATEIGNETAIRSIFAIATFFYFLVVVVSYIRVELAGRKDTTTEEPLDENCMMDA